MKILYFAGYIRAEEKRIRDECEYFLSIFEYLLYLFRQNIDYFSGGSAEVTSCLSSSVSISNDDTTECEQVLATV